MKIQLNLNNPQKSMRCSQKVLVENLDLKYYEFTFSKPKGLTLFCRLLQRRVSSVLKCVIITILIEERNFFHT